jgi:hypothetical protein
MGFTELIRHARLDFDYNSICLMHIIRGRTMRKSLNATPGRAKEEQESTTPIVLGTELAFVKDRARMNET